MICLACRRESYGRYCPSCELPLIDPDACLIEFRDQVQRASLVLQRRAVEVIRAREPRTIIRSEAPRKDSLLLGIFRELVSWVAPLVANLRPLREKFTREVEG